MSAARPAEGMARDYGKGTIDSLKSAEAPKDRGAEFDRMATRLLKPGSLRRRIERREW